MTEEQPTFEGIEAVRHALSKIVTGGSNYGEFLSNEVLGWASIITFAQQLAKDRAELQQEKHQLKVSIKHLDELVKRAEEKAAAAESRAAAAEVAARAK